MHAGAYRTASYYRHAAEKWLRSLLVAWTRLAPGTVCSQDGAGDDKRVGESRGGGGGGRHLVTCTTD